MKSDMKRKYNIYLIAIAILCLAAIIAMAVSIHYCSEWNLLIRTLPPFAVKIYQHSILLAYIWIIIAFGFMCCFVITAITWFMIQQRKHPEITDFLTNSSDNYLHQLNVDLVKNVIYYNGTEIKSRHQVVQLLSYLLQTPKHEIMFQDFNELFYENFYDLSSQAKQRLSNLKYETNEALKETPFEISKPHKEKFALTLKKVQKQTPD